MNLPPDFAATLSAVQNYGILGEDQDEVRSRLVFAMHGVAAVQGPQTLQLGLYDWTGDLIRKIEAAIHHEICDPSKKALKSEYDNLLKKGLTPDGISAVSSVILPVIHAINPAFAVSTVVIYVAVWLLKKGLNAWCSTAPPGGV